MKKAIIYIGEFSCIGWLTYEMILSFDYNYDKNNFKFIAAFFVLIVCLFYSLNLLYNLFKGAIKSN